MNSNTITEMTAEQLKTHEGRLRRRAKQMGFMLVKSRTRDPHAYPFGRYILVQDSAGNRYGRYGGQAAVSEFAKGYGLRLDQIEDELAAVG